MGSRTKPEEQPATTKLIGIEAAPEGGYVIYHKPGRNAERITVAAFSDIGGVLKWLGFNATKGGFALA